METDQGTAPAAGAPDIALAMMMRRELLRLAEAEDERARTEAARTPYWESCPDSVIAHTAAARVLRADADRFLVRSPRRRTA